jgi:IS30 family transposase
MKKYRQLAYKDRVYIEVLNAERKSKQEIAERLGCDVTTVWREYRRGTTSKSGYFVDHCYAAANGEVSRRQAASRRGRKPKLTGQVLEYVLSRLKLKWSPEQISGRMKLDGVGKVSHETIYKFIYQDKLAGGDLYVHLRWGRKRRKRRFGVPRIRADILNRKNISQRSREINERSRIGDWERDLMFGNSRKSALITFVERKSLLTIVRKVESKSPKEISAVTLEVFAAGKLKCLSITNDNGFEFRGHEQDSEQLKVPIYFTNPYSSWEKGTNENTNGLIRQYFSQITNMKEFTDAQAQQIEKALNNRPRKKLGFLTPLEFYSERKIAVIS